VETILIGPFLKEFIMFLVGCWLLFCMSNICYCC